MLAQEHHGRRDRSTGNRQHPGSRGDKWSRSYWPGCSRLYRFRADSWAGARPGGIRWRTRERHHGCGPSLVRAWHADALWACSSPHGSASTLGACPGRRARVVGLALLVLGPSGRVLGWLGWVWPLLLATLVVWSWRGAHRSLHNWSRRALLYPAFVILGLVALGGAYETISEATTSNAPTTGRTYLVGGHSLYVNCAGSGSPTVILFNGLGERTPSWAWVQRDVATQTRVCVFDRAGQGWSGEAPGLQNAHRLAADVDGLLAA